MTGAAEGENHGAIILALANGMSGFVVGVALIVLLIRATSACG